MLLYKFKSFSAINHLCDLLLNERLYCAEYGALNDPFEGVFWLRFLRPPAFFREMAVVRNISEYSWLQNKRVCSLSSVVTDVRLWSYYGGAHAGVAVELDISGCEQDFQRVHYSDDLPRISDSLLDLAEIQRLLLHKTNHWHFESEYRLITDSKWYSIAGRIRRVFAGPRINPMHLELLARCVENIPVVQTRLDSKTVTIVPA